MQQGRVETSDAHVHSPGRDAGFSLVEMVVTVTIMALAMIPILIAAMSLIRTSSYTRTATKVETVLTNAADKINRTGESCVVDKYRDTVEAALAVPKWDESLVTTQFFYFVPGPTVSDAGTWAEGLCPPNALAKDVVQMVKISLTSPDGKVHRSMQVVKSKI